MSESLGDKRRQAGAIGRSNRSAWREHAIFLGADWLAVEYLERPSSFIDGIASYKACRAKDTLHIEIAAAILRLLSGQQAAPKKLGDEAVRNLFRDWRQLLETTFQERLLVRQTMPAAEYGPDEADIVAAANAIAAKMGTA